MLAEPGQIRINRVENIKYINRGLTGQPYTDITLWGTHTVLLALKVQKDATSLRFSIPDKGIRDELKEKVNNHDTVIVEVVEIVPKGNLLKTIPVRGRKIVAGGKAE
jgi:uncharacterized protein (DUF488 family)